MNMFDSIGQKLPYLDGWRGFAIVAVLCGHFGPKPTDFVGGFGVLLFFVLSGFFMSDLLFIKKVPLLTFFVRRVTRVLPTFWMFTSAMVIYASTWQPVPYHVPTSEFVATLFFLRTYLPLGSSIFSDRWAIGHSWSLNVEEHSYVFLAIGAALFARYRKTSAARWFLIGSTAAIIFVTLFYALHPPSSASPWRARSECASLGLVASAAYRVWRHEIKWARSAVNPLLVLVAFCASGLCFAPFMPGGLDRTLAPLLAAFAVNHVKDMPESVLRILSLKILRWFGLCSFSIYLWQQPFYLLVKLHDCPALICAGLALITGAVSFYVFENPLRANLNRRWARHQTNKAKTLVQMPD